MRKRIFGFILAMVMVAAIPLNASAETIKGSSDWQVAFDGNKMSSNFKSSDLDASVYQLLPGAKGKIELQVTLDGETQGNDYQNTLARLQMSFAAEVVEGGNTTVTKPGKDIKIIKTGDNSNIIMYLSLAAFAAGMIILIIAILLVKRRKENKKRRSR